MPVTGKPVKNEDAGKWNGGGENIHRVKGEGIKQPLTEDSLGTTKHAQQTVLYLLTNGIHLPEDSLGTDSKQTAQTV